MMKSKGVPVLLPLWIAFTVGALMSSSTQAQMMEGSTMGGMVWSMAIFWLLIVAVLVLAIAALVKYLFRK
ncbi:MAG: hypothetical protein EPN31_07490 [Castellaniella sp.]|uniref:hypothetical protein n=1 Tax=Castellaniella sp. TaxID=1955812 RepID=UPI0011F4C3FB|nr:hypothetical protein [Castellaniella sp.]TAN28978.1 MAG: hypothetical protein EPN31_07490 [Castellaniella sp.]